MIDGKEYTNTVKDYFSFLIDDFGFRIIEEKIRGNAFYEVQYSDLTKVVSVSYENIQDYFQVIVFMLQNGKLPDYDDKSKTLHLNNLNKLFRSKNRESDLGGNAYFEKFTIENSFERKILKSAKELRACLYHFDTLF